MKLVKNILLFVLAAAFILVSAPSASAAALTGVVDTPSSLVAGASSNHSVVFTTATATAVKSVEITFPAGFDISTATLGTYTPVNSEATPVLGIASQVATVTFGTASAAATATYTIVINGVVNTSTSGNATVSVTTKSAVPATIDGPTTSANFLVAPAAISTFTCEPSGQGGAVWLRWSTPTGTSAGYEAQYIQGNTITWDTGTTVYSQTWASGTVGVAQQQLLTGLNPNTQYTFVMRALGGNTSESANSTTTPICYAPGAAKAVVDTMAPVTQITSPAIGSTVSASDPLIIKGSSMDKGGSSVQMVELSVDGGTTWNKADITLADDGNRLWQYTWARPSAGSQKILVRANDWMGNTETPVELSVTIVSGAVTTTPAPTTPVTPVAPTTPTDKAALIASIETQLKTLLTQLIALLTAQIQAQLAQ